MNLLVDNIQWVLLVCGLLTFSLVQGVFAPRSVLNRYFGEIEPSEAAVMLLRSWATLVAISGLFLIYAALTPAVRPTALIVVGTGKLVFVSLIVSQPPRFLKGQARVAAAVDGVMVVIFAAYLITTQIPA